MMVIKQSWTVKVKGNRCGNGHTGCMGGKLDIGHRILNWYKV